MRKELLKRVMVADRYKKGLAVLMSLALAATTFSAAPSSEAAAKTTPSLSAKKKTLYYNGTKKFTLKVKKNKAKKIVKTTWKTSNKKVAAISKKKKTSVVVTAKKEGSAKITATVSYKAGSKTKKVKLTCKVTSKKESENTDNTNTDGNTTPTKAPGGDTTPAPTQDGNVTPAPTQDGNVTPAPTQGGNVTPAPTQGGNATPAPTQGGNATPTPTQGGNATPTPTQGGNATPTPTPTPALRPDETIEGESIRSREYSMKEKNSTVTFYVEALDETHAFIELQQGNKYITLNTWAEAWAVPEGTAEIDPKYIINSNFNNFQPGGIYTIIITRKDYVEANKDKTDYEFVIKNTYTNADYVKFTAKNTTLTGDVSAHLVVWGSIKISDTVPKPQPQNHGTDRTRRYSLSDVNNTPPEDYVIPEGLVRDAKDKAYEKYFPKDSIQTVKVNMDESNLNYMLQHADIKPSVMTNSVTIGDTTLGYAGIKTKGNYTLAQTNESDSDRFSFTLNFGKYIKKNPYGAKQNFYGCKKISFNNCYFDKTIMKEYNAMRLMDEMGIPTPQYSLAKLYINDKYYGVYFMVEAMDSAIIERYQNATSKEVSDYLVKPSYTHMSYGFEDKLEKCLENGEFTMEKLNQEELLGLDEDGNYYASEWLWENYGGIWEGDYDTLQDVAKMIPTVLTWNRKIQLLSDGKDFDGNPIDVNSDEEYLGLLDTLMDTEEAVKYFATHSFLVQMDNMITLGQNYGLYVGEDGKSLFVPWDYDLAWGTAIWSDGHITAEQSANWDIDKMYPDNFEDLDENGRPTNYGNLGIEEVYSRSPLFHVIWQNNKLKEKYYTYMKDCAKRVSLGGTLLDGTKVEPARFAKTIETYYSQVTEAARIEDLAENVYYVGGIEQPKGTQEGIPELKKLIARRAVSVWLQTHKIKTTVTGYGCDILKLGANFVYDENTDRPTVKEKLAVVDEGTGIFAIATYPFSNDEASLKAEQVISGDDYTKISAKEGLTDPLVYKIDLANADKLTSEYKLYIPVSPGKENANIYAYSAETDSLEKLTAEKTDNVYCVTGTGFTYIVVD